MPKFVGAWLKKTSATGYLRKFENPLMRRQDITKQRMLCGDCEQIFSPWEKAFAETVFRPHHDGVTGITYGDWLLPFAISLAWRTVQFELDVFRREKSQTLVAILEDTASQWSDYLLGNSKDAGPYEHHVLLLDESIQLSDGMPEKLLSYLFRTVDQTIASSSTKVYVYSKLPGIIFWTAVLPPRLNGWKGTKIVTTGNSLQDQIVGDGGFLEFLTDRANEVYRVAGVLPQSQLDKMADDVLKDPKRALASGSFKVMIQEIERRKRNNI